jgi:serine/threonine protein kinase
MARDATACSSLAHAHTSQLHKWRVIGDKVLMAFEYMPRGTLHKSIYDSDKTFSAEFVRAVSFAMFRGLSFLHEIGIIHCDIKVRLGSEYLSIAYCTSHDNSLTTFSLAALCITPRFAILARQLTKTARLTHYQGHGPTWRQNEWMERPPRLMPKSTYGLAV